VWLLEKRRSRVIEHAIEGTAAGIAFGAQTARSAQVAEARSSLPGWGRAKPEHFVFSSKAYFPHFFLTPAPPGRTIRPPPFPSRALYFGRCFVNRPPQLRGVPLLAGKTVLLIDRGQHTREARAAVLRNHGIEVHEAESLQAARFLWQPDVYDLILLDLRKHLPGEAREFYQQIRTASPKEHFAFLVGPPVYLSVVWPREVTADDASPGQWGKTINRFLIAA